MRAIDDRPRSTDEQPTEREREREREERSSSIAVAAAALLAAILPRSWEVTLTSAEGRKERSRRNFSCIQTDLIQPKVSSSGPNSVPEERERDSRSVGRSVGEAAAVTTSPPPQEHGNEHGERLGVVAFSGGWLLHSLLHRVAIWIEQQSVS